VLILRTLFEGHRINTCRRKAFIRLKDMEGPLSVLHLFPDLTFSRPAFFGESKWLGGPPELN
jgi:hypothetical protein